MSNLRSIIRGPDSDVVRAWVARQRARLTPLLRPYFADAGTVAENLLMGKVLVAANRAFAEQSRRDGNDEEARSYAAQADATEASIQRIADMLEGRTRRRFDKLTTLPDLDITAAHE